jgi:hypothetical protein
MSNLVHAQPRRVVDRLRARTFSAWWLILGGILALGFWLRWRYVREISLYVDEFTTLWAARQVQAHGLPLMPSGVLYTRGLLSSYIEALFLTLFGFSYSVGRLPSVLFGLGTIVAIFWSGRRGWRPAVGWLAALGLALLPEAILWSGRARFYAQLQFFVLLTVWAAWQMVAEYRIQDTKSGERSVNRHARWLFPLFFILALFSQEETILLYPATVLATGLWSGWHRLLRREMLIVHTLCLLAIMARFGIEILGQPGYFETIQADRPYVGLIFDLRGAWRTYSPLLIAPERIGWTLGALLVVGAALLTLRQRQWRLTALPRFHQATLFFALHFGVVVGVIFLFVGTTWRDPRYLFLVQPFWLLLGAAGWVWLVERLMRNTVPVGRWPLARTITTAGVSVLIVLTLYPAAARVVGEQVEGYDQALGYLSSVIQPEDVVLSPQPPACALVLGQCDFYAVQQGYEEYVIRRDNRWIDRWTGSTLLNQTAQLAETIRTTPRTWFVTDSFRLATRYDADFVDVVIEQFALAHQSQGVMVLQAEGWQTPPPLPITRTLAPPVDFSPLALSSWARGEATPGADLQVELRWLATHTIDQQFNTSLRLVNKEGTILVQDDGPPTRGLIPTTLFFETPRPDRKRLTLPTDLPPGRYRLDVAAYDVTTLTPLSEPHPIDWIWIGSPPEPPATGLELQWRNGLRLVGSNAIPAALQPGESLSLRLVWSADQPITENLTVFVHLVGDDGLPVAQVDRAPEGGFYPTSAWPAGELIADSYTLTVPTEVAPGGYSLVVGVYNPTSSARIPLGNGGDSAPLAQLSIATRQ